MLAKNPMSPRADPNRHALLSLLYKHFSLYHPFADMHPKTMTEQSYKFKNTLNIIYGH